MTMTVTRRIELSKYNTPWGSPHTRKEIHRGIWAFTTASHGGFALSDERQAEFDTLFPHFVPWAEAGWYEEDCDVCAVVIAFHNVFRDDELRAAVRQVRGMAKGDRKWIPLVEYIDANTDAGYSIRMRSAIAEAAESV